MGEILVLTEHVYKDIERNQRSITSFPYFIEGYCKITLT